MPFKLCELSCHVVPRVAHHSVEVGLARIHFTNEWILISNIRLENFIYIPSCLRNIYMELSSPKFYVYLRIFIFCAFFPHHPTSHLNIKRPFGFWCVFASIWSELREAALARAVKVHCVSFCVAKSGSARVTL